MQIADISTLDARTLSPRHFAEAGVRRHELHVWSELTGFTSKVRSAGKWRRFSPADVFRLSTLDRFKERAQLALSSNEPLLHFLANPEAYAAALRIFATGASPQLLADLCTTFEIVEAWRFDSRRLSSISDFWVALDLSRPVLFSVIAALRGGNADQRDFSRSLVLQSPRFILSRNGGRKIDTRSRERIGEEEALRLAEATLAGTQ